MLVFMSVVIRKIRNRGKNNITLQSWLRQANTRDVPFVMGLQDPNPRPAPPSQTTVPTNRTTSRGRNILTVLTVSSYAQEAVYVEVRRFHVYSMATFSQTYKLSRASSPRSLQPGTPLQVDMPLQVDILSIRSPHKFPNACNFVFDIALYTWIQSKISTSGLKACDRLECIQTILTHTFSWQLN